MLIPRVRKSNNFLIIALSGGCCGDYLQAAASVEEVKSLMLSIVKHC
jgi:hypothetical protein